MLKPLRIVLAISPLLLTAPAQAAVIINEVAWMGDLDSANHEWIELYNDSATAVDVEGWSLSDGVNLNLTLSGVIPGQAFAVLERTSDDSAPGPAFLVYRGALVNTGATLVLRDAALNIMDQVAGGSDWENIGGDNVAKNTAQYTSSGWVTDVPTPGRLNGSGLVAPAQSEEKTAAEKALTGATTKSAGAGANPSSKATKAKSSASVKLKNEATDLQLKINIQSVAYVNQKVPLSVMISGFRENEQPRANYYWNFGDSYTAETRQTAHVYRYPGTYVVTVLVHHNKQEQVARHEITVLPVAFSLTQSAAGDVQINNDAAYDVDVSGYTLRGVKEVVLPPRTIILPRGTLTIEASRLGGFGNSLLALYDARNTLVTSTFKRAGGLARARATPGVRAVVTTAKQPRLMTSAVAPAKTTTVSQAVAAQSTVDKNFKFLTAVAEAEELPRNEIAVMEPTAPSTELAASAKAVEEPITPAAKPSSYSNQRWPYVAFIILLLLGLLAIFSNKAQNTKTLAE